MRYRLIHLLLGAVFAAVLVGLAVALHHVLPPQPRWRISLEKGETVEKVEPVHGRIFTLGPKGIGGIDLFSGARLGLLVAGKDFTRHSDDKFSPDHKYYVVRLFNGRKIGIVNAATLRTAVIDVHAKKEGYDRTPYLHFSPDSQWLAVGIRDDNGPPVKVVVVDLARGKTVFETGGGSYFRSFIPDSNLIACEQTIKYMSVYAAAVWDFKTGKKAAQSPPFLFGYFDETKHFHYYPREWSADGRTLIACRKSAEGKIELAAWDVVTNRLKCIVPADVRKAKTGPRLSPDGTTLVAAGAPDGKKLIFFDLKSGMTKQKCELDPCVIRLYIWFSPDGRTAVCSTLTDTLMFRPLMFRLPSGKPLKDQPDVDDSFWQFMPDSKSIYWIDFEGQMGHMLLSGEFTFHFQNQQRKHTATCGPFLTDSCWPPEHEIGSRLAFVRSGSGTDSGQAISWVRQWLPIAGEPSNDIHSVDTTTGRKTGRLRFTSTPGFRFSEKHNLLATWNPENNHVQLACWDVPFRPPWTWVLGPPLALGLLAVGFVVWRRAMIRKAKKKLTNVDC